MKKLLLCVLLVCSSILAGCSATSTKKQTIAFDDYRISLPAEYREVSSSLIENKQILNKVLKSYKKDEDRQFATNLVITKSVIAPELDYEQFWTANTNKLKSFLVGYQAGDKQLISFDCGETSIKGIYVSFSIENSFL
ncbi:MAG: hypothetical protein H6765_07255 [Candidatus Peribacteria bacterium]|nr:MAG: hypothetical protein H6765_07255 [Candidatus Peribacteria bacterium]